MSVKIWQGGALRTASSIKVTVGGVQRTIRSIRIMSGGSLRTVYTAASTLTVSVTSPVYGTGDGYSPQTVITSASTCTPSGGVPPYTYSWSHTGFDGGVITSPAATNPTFATTSFSATVPAGGGGLAFFFCTVTDSLGATGQSTDVEAFFTNSAEV